MRYVVLVLLFACSAAYANVDSSGITPPNITPVVTPFLLEHGTVSTSKANNFQVHQSATSKRCPSNAIPTLTTSISSVQAYGLAQAIEGITNTLTLDSNDYSIHGQVSAPVNVEASDNGVTVNWQVWCQPNPDQVV